MIYLLLSIVLFTTTNPGLTKTEVLIPFPTREACTAARDGLRATNERAGIESGSAICVSGSEIAQTRPWPDQTPYTEQKKEDQARLDRLKDDMDQWKRDYEAKHK